MIASPQPLTSTPAAGLPHCNWRVGTKLPAVFYCRHSSVHSQNCLVSPAICKSCEQKSQPALLPRPYLDDPLIPRAVPPPAPWEYISLERLSADVRQLIGQLPSNLSGVAGIPRSGMLPAAQIALLLHLPLFELCRKKGLRAIGHGWRLEDRQEQAGPLLVVDDAVYTGDAMAAARAQLAAIRSHETDLFAAIYPAPEAADSLDFFARTLPEPQLFEWNLLNSNHTRGFAVDFDGILCADWPGGDEEGEAYRNSLKLAAPRWLPRYKTVPLIVTARLEKHRAASEEWLQRHGVLYEKLVMGPWGSTQERNVQFRAAEYKARVYADSRCGVFIESSELQAEIIHGVSKKPVLCPNSGRIFQ